MNKLIEKDLKVIISGLSLLEKLYDVVRIVDPITKKIIFYKEIQPTQSNCYDFWKSGHSCNNCISSRALHENDTIVKIEYNKERIFMLLASPTIFQHKTFVVEMLKDITETGIISNFNEKTVDDITQVVYEMNQESIRDSLTKVYNKPYINQQLPVDLYNASEAKKPISFILGEVDYFHDIQNTYGHHASDLILSGFATVIRSCIRENQDWIARYSNEKFFVTIYNADNNLVFLIAETIRKKILNLDLEYENNKIKITASFGTYTLDNDSLTYRDIIALTNKNLIKAQNKGRNRTLST